MDQLLQPKYDVWEINHGIYHNLAKQNKTKQINKSKQVTVKNCKIDIIMKREDNSVWK